MTLKRLIIILLTVLVALLVGNSLLRSLGEAQITNRLQLYQTNLLLYATEPQGEEASSNTALRQAVLGKDPLNAALEQYQTVRKTAQKDLETLQTRLTTLSTNASSPSDGSATGDPTSAEAKQLLGVIRQQQNLIHQIDLRIGLIQAKQGDRDNAARTWQDLIQQISLPQAARTSALFEEQTLLDTAQTLDGLWSTPPRILPEAEQHLQKHLDGWFRYVALVQLYTLQQRADALDALTTAEAAIAQQTLVKLGLIGTVPVLGSVIGALLLISLLVQRLVNGKQSILATHADQAWETPWDWETILWVLILGFFFVGQIAVPALLSVLGISFGQFGGRAKAIYSLTFYTFMAGAGLSVLFFAIRRYFPLPEGWFRFRVNVNWLLWGLGGYLAALPLMILVSLINQQIWQGQGGSNPLLQIVLEEGDPISLGIFLFTAAVAAPLFEETLFRGFLLPSLTRYVPVWGAIALSSLVFAIAHLSLSEVIPLTMLGTVLGFIYTRSRNLLAPMLLHSLWNSVTMVGLFLLGSGAH